MKKLQSRIWMIIGICMILAAVVLCCYNMRQNQKGAEYAEYALAQLQELIPTIADDKAEESGDSSQVDELEQSDILSEYDIPEKETLIEIDGRYYLGTISIPAIGIELPVLSEWSYANLKISPCRYQGTVAEGNLIIAAHNFSSHFGRIKNLNPGDEIYFTDGDGTVHTYEVVQSNLIYGYNVSGMEDGADDWDLTLFTCTWSGTNRMTIRAVEK
ncbi:MAG: sortase [Ruminococcus sp.]|nr:sortase [Ruminococcus sp.]